MGTDTTGNVHIGRGSTVGGSIIGGGNSGPIYVGGAQAPQPYERKRVRVLPITERAINVAATLVALFTFFSGYQTYQQAAAELQAEGPAGGSPQLTWLLLLVATVCVAGVLIALSTLIHRRNQAYSRFSFLPGIAGVTDPQGRGRLALLSNTGTCQQCGGRLRFYAKPFDWRDIADPQTGRVKRHVIRRRGVAECVRNPEGHYAWLDGTDTADVQTLQA